MGFFYPFLKKMFTFFVFFTAKNLCFLAFFRNIARAEIEGLCKGSGSKANFILNDSLIPIFDARRTHFFSSPVRNPESRHFFHTIFCKIAFFIRKSKNSNLYLKYEPIFCLCFLQLVFYTNNYFGIAWCHFWSVRKQMSVFRLFTAIFGL